MIKGILLRYIFFSPFSLLFLNCYGQKNDYNWLQGYSFGPPSYDTSLAVYAGTTVADFNYNPVMLSFDSSFLINFDETNTGYSDSGGSLLFYTNGMFLINKLGEVIEGSDSINQGVAWQAWYPMGYRMPQGILAFQNPADVNRYYLVHSYWDDPLNANYCSQTLSSQLDMSQNAGMGNMLYANHPIVEDTLGWELAATRHGNGRDWWIITQKRNSNCYYRILLDQYGLYLIPDSDCGGAFVNILDIGTSSFSADGSKFAHFTIETGVTLFDFDRCTGDLTNPMVLPSDILDSSWIAAGIAFSPNGRFLYISATKRLFQYDLWAPDIASSIDTVGIYDGYYVLNTPALQTVFNTAQAGPDGKIYISCGNGAPVYHVINNPDLKGDSCNFKQHSFPLPSISLGVPNFPNYRLGPLIASACDTLTSLSEVAREQKESILKVFPNPATDIVTVDYGFTNWSAPGLVTLEIVNVLGRIVYSQPAPQYSGYQRIDVRNYSTGIYTAYIKRNEQVIATQKFAKE